MTPTQKAIQEHLDKKSVVKIRLNSENGCWVWAVEVLDDPEFWLDAFPTLDDAMEFCKQNDLPCATVE